MMPPLRLERAIRPRKALRERHLAQDDPKLTTQPLRLSRIPIQTPKHIRDQARHPRGVSPDHSLGIPRLRDPRAPESSSWRAKLMTRQRSPSP